MRGGSLFATCTTIHFTGITIIHNSKSREGAAIHVVTSSIVLVGTTQFWNNLAQYGGAIFSESSNFTFGASISTGGKEHEIFFNFFFYHRKIILGLELEPGSSFVNNTTLRGGALHLDHQSTINIHPLTCMFFKKNTAREYGGAIYVIDITGTHTCPPALDLPS